MSVLTCDGVASDIGADHSLNWTLAISWYSINLEAGDWLGLGSPANGDGGLSGICHAGPSWRADICVGSQAEISAYMGKALIFYFKCFLIIQKIYLFLHMTI